MTNAALKEKSVALLSCVCVAAAMVAAAGEVRVSDFGYDPEDSTRFVQAALDSKSDRVVIDNIGKPWIVQPLFVRRSNVEIVFERGVGLRARRGAFLGKRDALLSLVGVANVTVHGCETELRMWKEDYANSPYEKGEWRHAVNLLAVTNVTVEGLTCRDSGGDGVYVGGRGGCRNVVLRGLDCDGNHRQGMSVISADGLLIENCRMRNTCGTDPQAGIDFEPNLPGETITNCIVRNCTTENNRSIGYEIYLGAWDATSPQLDIVFENCRSIGDDMGFTLTGGKKNADAAHDDGRVVFRNCTFTKCRRGAFRVTRRPHASGRVEFHDCLFDDVSTQQPRLCDMRVSSDGHDPAHPDEIVLDRVTIRQSARHA